MLSKKVLSLMFQIPEKSPEKSSLKDARAVQNRLRTESGPQAAQDGGRPLQGLLLLGLRDGNPSHDCEGAALPARRLCGNWRVGRQGFDGAGLCHEEAE